MSQTAKEIFAAAIFFAVFATLAWLATDFGPRARMIPLPLAVAGMALAAIQIVLCLVGRPQQRLKMITVDESTLPPDAAGDASSTAVEPRRVRPEWTAYASIAGLTGLVLAVGPVIAIFAFTSVYFLRTRLYSAARSLIYAALFTAGVQLLFFTTLQIEPYYGLLAPLIANIR